MSQSNAIAVRFYAPRASRSWLGRTLDDAGERWRRRRRHQLASGYERVVRTADRPTTGISSRIPVRRAAVLGARYELLRIAALLSAPRGAPRAGVAAARQLLCDGNGPLYVEGDLDQAARRVLELLGDGP